MKQITELLDEEILNLTTDQINKMIQFKMAEAGIKILEKPIEPTYGELPKKTVLLFEVSGITNLFTDKKIADDVARVLAAASLSMKSISYIGDSYTHKKVINLDEYDLKGIGKVSEVLVFSSDDAIAADKILKANKEAKKQYDALLAEFKSNENEADYIRVDVWDRVKQVRDKYSNMAEMKYQYERYMELAEGNKAIAMNFLKKAYSISEETEYYVQGLPYQPIEDGYETTAKSEGGVN